MTKPIHNNTKLTHIKKPRLSLTSIATLSSKPSQPDWLVKDILVAKQPLVIGGPPKSLKTSLALDLAVSLGTGTHFLNTFQVSKQRRVAVFSGESGQTTINETLQRIVHSKGKSVDTCLVHCGFRLPRLSHLADRNELRALLKKEEIEVVVIDPLYLCLLAGSQNLSAANLYDIGPILAETSEACSRAGATLVLVHHTTKTSQVKPGLATLTDLSFSGVAEFARQWVLISRSKEYIPGSGKHDLILSIGGSAGHSSRWNVRIDEGSGNGKERDWSVEIEGDQPDKQSYCRTRSGRKNKL